jgi:hypothetical protein
MHEAIKIARRAHRRPSFFPEKICKTFHKKNCCCILKRIGRIFGHRILIFLLLIESAMVNGVIFFKDEGWN